MATKTKTVHGWCYVDDTAEMLHSMSSMEDCLFEKQEYAKPGYALKRMTIVMTIKDYEPKRKTKT